MASYQFEVTFTGLRGLGPDSIERTITVVYDDVDDDVTADMVRSWAIADAKNIMRERTERGYPVPRFVSIERS